MSCANFDNKINSACVWVNGNRWATSVSCGFVARNMPFVLAELFHRKS